MIWGLRGQDSLGQINNMMICIPKKDWTGLWENGWCELHKLAEVEVMAARASDHNPILVSLTTAQPRRVRGKGNFKFEASWIPDIE